MREKNGGREGEIGGGEVSKERRKRRRGKRKGENEREEEGGSKEEL